MLALNFLGFARDDEAIVAKRVRVMISELKKSGFVEAFTHRLSSSHVSSTMSRRLNFTLQMFE